MAKPNNRSTKRTNPAAAQRTGPAQSNARAALKAQQAAQRQAAQRRRLLVVVIGVIVVALIVVLVVVLANRGQRSPLGPASTTSPAASSTATSTAPTPGQTTPPAALQITPPDAGPDQGWIELKSDAVKPDALTVDIHFDYQCPFCAMVEQPYGPVFEALVASGDIIYRAHVRTFVGDVMLKNIWSQQAAVAASCADTVGAFLAYSQTVFDHQPAEGVGYTDQQLRTDFAGAAGITGAQLRQFQSCYDDQQTLDFVQTMETNNWNSTTINFNVPLDKPVRGTPTLFVNGKSLSTNDLIGPAPTYAPLIDTTTPAALLAKLKQVAAS